MNPNNRRRFLSDTFSTVASFGVGAAFSGMGSHLAHADGPIQSSSLQPMKDATTGLPLLRLPEGFRYLSFGWTRDMMSDGSSTPAAHDGMGVIGVDGDVLTLCRNHELSDDGPAMPIAKGQPFDRNASAGCTMLKFDTAAEALVDSRVCFSGTSRNCAGGVTPWGTWLTCEETVLGPNDHDPYKDHALRAFQEEHGWIFEVPMDASGAPAGKPQPLRDMGRFVHEAVAVDRETGIVYETEDRGSSGFYRFIPTEPGNLAAGGRLEMAEVVGQDDLRGGFSNGSTFDVRWHRIDHPEQAHTPESEAKALQRWKKHLEAKASNPAAAIANAKSFKLGDELGVYKQGKAKGGSTFSRLEGCWYGNGLIYFDATNGGAAKAGQIWQYDPKNEKLTLLFESPNKPTLNMPDNLCVSPRGGIVLCEDNDYGANEYPHRVFTLSQDGKLSLFAENNVRLNGQKNGIQGDFRSKEWAGATFSPDGQWLFINIQSPGVTFAITGPWEDTFV